MQIRCRLNVIVTQVIDGLNVIAHNQPEWLTSLINQASAVSLSLSSLVWTINHHHHHEYHQPGIQRYSINQQFKTTSPPSFALSWRQNHIRSTFVWKCSISQLFYLLQGKRVIISQVRPASKWKQTIWTKEIW